MHICNGTAFAEDEEGRELADEHTAREEAVAAARAIMAGELRGGELNLASFIEVEDETRTLLFTIPFAEAVTITAG